MRFPPILNGWESLLIDILNLSNKPNTVQENVSTTSCGIVKQLFPLPAAVFPHDIKALHLCEGPLCKGVGLFGNAPLQQDIERQPHRHGDKLIRLARVLDNPAGLTSLHQVDKPVEVALDIVIHRSNEAELPLQLPLKHGHY